MSNPGILHSEISDHFQIFQLNIIDENETQKKVGTVQYRKLNANNISRFNIMLDKVSFENVYKEHDANLTNQNI